MGLQVGFGVIIVLMMSLFADITEAQNEVKVFNVLNYGAIANGRSDMSKALGAAWRDACQWKGTGAVVIPKGVFMLHPVKFQGPCSGRTMFLNSGLVRASSDPAFFYVDSWISFENIDGLRLSGGGTFDGQGNKAWSHNECHQNPDCKTLSPSITFDSVTNSIIDHITSVNSKMFHFNIAGNQKVNISKIRIVAPADSPNTDGIHIGRSNKIRIANSVIGTGDDCVSLKHGSRDIDIVGVTCGPGHGISIGSLGMSAGEQPVSRISVKSSRFRGSDNGLRIKTWASAFPNLVSQVSFHDIIVDNVKNPIIIDQDYCPTGSCTSGQSQVQIKDVHFRNISGISSTKVAVTLQCSQKFPCSNIELHDINLSYTGPGGPAASSQCKDVHGFSSGIEKPSGCI